MPHHIKKYKSATQRKFNRSNAAWPIKIIAWLEVYTKKIVRIFVTGLFILIFIII